MKMGTWGDCGSHWSLYGDVKFWDLKTESYSLQYQVSLLWSGWFTGAFSEANAIARSIDYTTFMLVCHCLWAPVFLLREINFLNKTNKSKVSYSDTRIGSMRAGQSGHAILKEPLWWTDCSQWCWQGCQLCSLCIWTGHPRPSLGALIVLVNIYSYGHSWSQTRGHRDMKWNVLRGDPHFVIAAILVVIVVLILISLLGLHHENKHSCYITICSVSGVLLVGYVKGLGITLKNFLLQSLSWDILWLGFCC